MPAPTLLKRSRLDESIAKLKELLADLEAGKLGKEPRAIVVIDVPGADSSTTVIYGLAMDLESISQAYFILSKALRKMDGPAR
jgi:hypothetical protein